MLSLSDYHRRRKNFTWTAFVQVGLLHLGDMNEQNISNFKFGFPSPPPASCPTNNDRFTIRGQISNGMRTRVNALGIREVEPWQEAVDGKALLDELASVLTRFVVLPRWAAETLALWVLHTYAFELRDISTYIGIESPEKRCGKTTLLAVLSELVCRPVVAANISSPAFFRVIEELRPTLLIDEADTFLQGNDELRGILNSGYARSTAFVVRVANEVFNHREHGEEEGFQPLTGTSGSRTNEHGLLTEGNEANEGTGNSQTLARAERRALPGSRLASYSCWCPKVMAAIGRLPDTLADRCIVIRMQRKSNGESCERLRLLDAEALRRKCARFVLDHRDVIAMARPQIPEGLNDRAADIWEPLLVLADLAGVKMESFTGGNGGNGEGLNSKFEIRTGSSGGHTKQIQNSNDGILETTANVNARNEEADGTDRRWAVKAREAAVGLTGISQENNPIASLLMDLLCCFAAEKSERVFSRTLVQRLNWMSGRPWNEMTQRKTKEAPQGVTDVWLARVLRPYGVRPRTMRIGEAVAKGYSMDDFTPVFQRYIPRSEVDDTRARFEGKSPEQVEMEEEAKELSAEVDE